MKKKMDRFTLSLMAAVVVCMIAVAPGALLAQAPTGPNQAPDLLIPLKRALLEAGAPELTSSQAEQTNTLITNFRSSNKPQDPGSAVQSARRDYDNAILNGDIAAAAAQAAILINDQSARASARTQAEATFAVGVVKVLRTNGDQVGLLLKRRGSSGVVRLVLSLAGGPGGPGQGANGPGQAPGGPGRP